MLTTTAFMKKVATFSNTQPAQAIGKVVKEDVPVSATSSGILKQVDVQDGDHVTSGQELMTYYLAGNKSPQIIKAPESGIIRRTSLTGGDVIEPQWKILTIYKDNKARLLVYLTEDQYNQIKKLNHLQAYSKRLDQAFAVSPKVLQADVQDTENVQEKIGVYFEFEDPTEVTSLLHNESLSLILPKQKTPKITDILSNFDILSR
jgi:hypothetical protein